MLKKLLMLFTVILLSIQTVQASSVKFAQISDIHYQPEAAKDAPSFKLKYYALDILDDALLQIKNENNVDFILVTGDAADLSLEKDFDYIYKYLNKNSPKKWYYVLGNHDVKPDGLKKADQIKILNNNGQKHFSNGKTYYSFKPKRDMTFIALDSTYDNKNTDLGYVTPEQLKFVDNIIKKSKKDVIVIYMHHPIAYPIISGHEVINDFAIMELLKKYDNPILILGGHYHACKIVQEGNIVKVASPALVSYPNAFRFITIDNNKNNTKFCIEYRDTNLKNIQELAKKKMKSGYFWTIGKDADRNAIIVIDKNKNK